MGQPQVGWRFTRTTESCNVKKGALTGYDGRGAVGEAESSCEERSNDLEF